jgi:hypothetical protein
MPMNLYRLQVDSTQVDVRHRSRPTGSFMGLVGTTQGFSLYIQSLTVRSRADTVVAIVIEVIGPKFLPSGGWLLIRILVNTEEPFILL